jgi:predicted transposase YdaD
MAVVAAMSRGRYKEMVRAMEEAKLEPVICEDLVRYGFDQGIEEGLEKGRAEGRAEGLEKGALEMARQLVLEVLEARGLTLTEGERVRLDKETSLERLRAWHRSGLTAASVTDVLNVSDI